MRSVGWTTQRPEAMRNAVPGLPMAEVATVDDALTALQTFTSGGTPQPCPAS